MRKVPYNNRLDQNNSRVTAGYDIFRKYGHYWNNEKLWNLELPATRIGINKLEGMQRVYWWIDDSGNPLNIAQLRNNPRLSNSHWQGVLKSDPINNPIYVTVGSKGRYIILDGFHRYAKAIHEGDQSISVKIVPEEMLKEIL